MRVCTRCNSEVEKEKEPSIDYPFYCPNCDENLYEFETSVVASTQKEVHS